MTVARFSLLRVALVCYLASAAIVSAWAAPQIGDPLSGPDGPPPPMQPNHGPMDRPMHAGAPPGRWWSDPHFVQQLSLSSDQQTKLDTIFNGNRIKLIDLMADLQKQEAVLEPLLETDRPDEKQVLAQIDKVAQARAELEKGNARMLLSMRRVLTQEQWRKLQANAPGRRPPHFQP